MLFGIMMGVELGCNFVWVEEVGCLCEGVVEV